MTMVLATGLGYYVLTDEEERMTRALVDSGEGGEEVGNFMFQLYKERRAVEVALGLREPEGGEQSGQELPD